MWGPFVEIAKSHLLHSETGLRFDQLTSPEDKLSGIMKWQLTILVM